MLRAFVDNTEKPLCYHRGDSVVVFHYYQQNCRGCTILAPSASSNRVPSPFPHVSDIFLFLTPTSDAAIHSYYYYITPIYIHAHTPIIPEYWAADNRTCQFSLSKLRK